MVSPQVALVERAQVEASWAVRGYRGGLWVDPPGQVWADQIHDVDELFMVLDGAVELTLGDLTIRPAVGEEVRIPAGTKHTVRVVGPSRAHWLYAYRA
jgi:quercetin dioxygenase-like cupin family protein